LEEVLSPSVLEGAKRFASLISSSPTSLETAVFDKLSELLPQYEYVVLDFAPTGQVLRFFDSLNLVQEWLEFLVQLSQRQEEIDRFMNRKRNLPQLLKERLQKVKFLAETLREKGLLFAVARQEPLALQEAQMLEKNNFIKTKIVINCPEEPTQELSIPKVEDPYGLENLKKIPIEKLALL
jgi:arsenite-transporting ATPase